MTSLRDVYDESLRDWLDERCLADADEPGPDDLHTARAVVWPSTGWTPIVEPHPGFASYCPHCGTGDPGEDYCASCGDPIVEPGAPDEARHG